VVSGPVRWTSHGSRAIRPDRHRSEQQQYRAVAVLRGRHPLGDVRAQPGAPARGHDVEPGVVDADLAVRHDVQDQAPAVVLQRFPHRVDHPVAVGVEPDVNAEPQHVQRVAHPHEHLVDEREGCPVPML
jgi:hypothetical protein